MCRIRAFEREIYEHNKKGLVRGTAHLYIGMEAIAVGACSAMHDGDLLTSTHRGHGHAIARGLDLGRMMAEVLGRSDGYCHGKGGSMHITDISRGMLGADGIVGGGIPIAAGAALGMRLRGLSSVVFCFFGEGASNQGSFHEAVNFAAVNQLAVIFICENNQWALSTAFKNTTAGGSVANRGTSYGIPGRQLDGNDVEAVFGATQEAVVHAAGGAGPSLLEFVSYRWEPHSIFTRRETRPQQEIDEWKKKDPIARYREVLIKTHGVPAVELDELDSEVQAEVAKASAFALGSPAPNPEAAIQDVFA